MVPWIFLMFVVVSPFSFLILLISQICQGLANLICLFKEPALFVDSLYDFSPFIVSLLFLVLDLLCPCFSRRL
jgi:hypothetical protein